MAADSRRYIGIRMIGTKTQNLFLISFSNLLIDILRIL